MATEKTWSSWATPADPRLAPLEHGPRSALLLWGGGLLILGIGLVGVGEPLGAAPLLAGLFNIVYGIHTYGRLGPEEESPDAEAIRRAETSSVRWTLGLTALACALVAADHFASGGGGRAEIAAPCALLGFVLWRLVQWLGRRGIRRRANAKVERRRRMDKSAAP